MVALGIDIGGTHTKIGVVNHSGIIIANKKIDTDDHDHVESYLKKILSTSKELSYIANKPILGVGVGAPHLNPVDGTIGATSNLKWDHFSLKENLSKLFKCPVFADNDANIAALGERYWGAGKDIDNFIVVTLGTGLGTGIFSQGKILHSASGLAGEGGHMRITMDNRVCGCGGKGHLESYVSVTGLIKSVHEETGRKYTFSEILDLYRKENRKILKIVDDTAKQLALGLSQFQTLLLPEKIIISGGMAVLGIDFLEQVKKSFQSFAYGPFKNLTEIEYSKISITEGAILGASALVFNNINKG